MGDRNRSRKLRSCTECTGEGKGGNTVSRTVHRVPTFSACTHSPCGAASFGMTVGLYTPGGSPPEGVRGPAPGGGPAPRSPFPSREADMQRRNDSMESGVFLSGPVPGASGGRKVPPSLLPCPQPPTPAAASKGISLLAACQHRG